MSALTDPNALAVSTDTLIDRFDKHGQLSMSRVENGWYCRIAMNTNTTGSEFTVKSDFGTPSLRAALMQLSDRMHMAIDAVAK